MELDGHTTRHSQEFLYICTVVLVNTARFASCKNFKFPAVCIGKSYHFERAQSFDTSLRRDLRGLRAKTTVGVGPEVMWHIITLNVSRRTRLY